MRTFSSALSVGNRVVGLEDEADVVATYLGELFCGQAVDRLARNADRAGGRLHDAAKDRKKRRLAGARRAHQQRQFARHKLEGHAFERNDQSGAGAEFLDDIVGVQDGGCGHLENTVAGSIFVTLTMAESAEIAHINNVNAKSQKAKPGVMTNGNDEFRLA